MFERFSTDARAVVVDAQLHARRLHHRTIGTEHLLLSLLAGGGAVAGLLEQRGCTVAGVEEAVARRLATPPHERDREALAALGIDLDRVREVAEAHFGIGALAHEGRRRRRLRRRGRRTGPDGAGPFGHLPFSRRAKTVLELSLREALHLRHRTITTEHLALGLLREGRGLASAVLADAGVDTDELRRAIEASMQRAA